MGSRFQASGRSPLFLFAPLALSIAALLTVLYFSTRQTPGRAQLYSGEPAPAAAHGLIGGDAAKFTDADLFADADLFTDADFARHVSELRKKVPGRTFTIIVQRPFVVVGDGTPAAVKSQS